MMLLRGMTHHRGCLRQQSNLFGTSDWFHGRQFFHGLGKGEGMVSGWLTCITWALFLLLYRLHLRSSDSRFQRLGIPLRRRTSIYAELLSESGKLLSGFIFLSSDFHYLCIWIVILPIQRMDLKETAQHFQDFIVAVWSLSRLTLCDPTDCSTPSFPVLRCIPEFA